MRAWVKRHFGGLAFWRRADTPVTQLDNAPPAAEEVVIERAQPLEEPAARSVVAEALRETAGPKGLELLDALDDEEAALWFASADGAVCAKLPLLANTVWILAEEMVRVRDEEAERHRAEELERNLAALKAALAARPRSEPVPARLGGTAFVGVADYQPYAPPRARARNGQQRQRRRGN